MRKLFSFSSLLISSDKPQVVRSPTNVRQKNVIEHKQFDEQVRTPFLKWEWNKKETKRLGNGGESWEQTDFKIAKVRIAFLLLQVSRIAFSTFESRRESNSVFCSFFPFSSPFLFLLSFNLTGSSLVATYQFQRFATSKWTFNWIFHQFYLEIKRLRPFSNVCLIIKLIESEVFLISFTDNRFLCNKIHWTLKYQ